MFKFSEYLEGTKALISHDVKKFIKKVDNNKEISGYLEEIDNF